MSPSTPHPRTIVIKLGTSSIIAATPPFHPLLPLLSSIVQTCVALREAGHRVVLVSSGAIGVGMKRMGLQERGKGLKRKQALAAIGQGRLIALWDNLFSQLEQPIAQVLLTRMDISDRTRYLNAQNTFSELLAMGVIPIVNENDTVAVSEIKFGDNDTLSAIAANMVSADFLFLMTDVDCLYTDNPRDNPDAKPVRVVRDINLVREKVSVTSLGSSLGTGGMSTKLIAAELATAAGVTTVIMRSTNVAAVTAIIAADEGPEDEDVVANEALPLCTRFLRAENRLADRKWWIAHGLHAAGSVTIDEGAHRAIQRKESGGRLLPAGVLSVSGSFASHQAVKLFVRRRVRSTSRSRQRQGGHDCATDMDDTPQLSGASTPSARGSHGLSSPANGRRDRSRSASGRASSSTHVHAGRAARAADSPTYTLPQTPNIVPAMSLSSSVASLDPLSRSAGPSSPHVGPARKPGPAAAPEGESLLQTATADPAERARGSLDSARDLVLGTQALDAESWEEIEIGKGLALYNSSEIDRVKGHRSTDIEKILGYSETAHVIDSIAFTDLRGFS